MTDDITTFAELVKDLRNQVFDVPGRIKTLNASVDFTGGDHQAVLIDLVDMLETIGNRLDVLHHAMKDAAGPTGAYPSGKLTEEDQGELAIKIYAQDRKIHFDFGKAVAWFALNPSDAEGLVQLLNHHIYNLKIEKD